MKKLCTLLTLLICVSFTTRAQDEPVELGTPGVTMDPTTVPRFVNDLPVINTLGLRVDLTDKKTSKIMVSMEETTQNLLGTLTTGEVYQTTVWGYKFPGLPVTYPGATIVAMKDQDIRIKWMNNLPGHFLPVDASLHMAHPATIHDVAGVRAWYDAGNVPTVAHLHGGHTESGSDGLPEQWFTQGHAERGQYWAKQQFRYDNDQEAATLWYHDHALGITRLNVYAGLAGFYLLRDENENALVADGVLPGGEYEIEIVIQDRLFTTDGQLFWPSYPGETPYDDFIFGEGADLPPALFPGGGPSALAEFFGNIILVNGKAWPRLEVEPRKYRFRLLNGSDSRFYVLQLDNGADMMIIGTDDGLLDTPVNVSTLEFAPGERYDVVIDFSGSVSPNITLLNLGPDEPYGGGIPGEDYTSSDSATTGGIMQFQVNLPKSEVPDASVITSSVLNSIARFDPALAVNAATPRQLVLFEGMDEFGRLQPMLGTMAEGSKTWTEATTENPANRSTEIWEVYNATGDAHPIHLHLVAFQILNRESFDGVVTARPQIQHNSLPGVPPTISTPPTDEQVLALRAMNYGIGGVLTGANLWGDATGPAAHERGWKDTFIVPPGQVGRLIAHFDRPGRYVWHCHILSHEDHEMMRAFHVGPIPLAPGGGKKGASVGDQDVPDWSGEFRLYPNPASDRTTVEFVLASDSDVRVSIYGMDGRLINTEELGRLNEGVQAISVPLEHLDNGMYIFELKAGDKQFRESIMISK